MRTHYLKLAAAAFLGTALAGAQPQTESKPDSQAPAQQTRPRAEGQRFVPGGGGRFGPVMERLSSVLTDEQRASLREAMQAQREKMRDVEEKLRDAQKELFEAGLVDKFDEEAIRQKAMTMAKLEAELTVLRAKAFSQMRPPLSAKQLETLRNQPPMAAGEGQGERQRRRPDVQRDEHGLPPKDRLPSEPK